MKLFTKLALYNSISKLIIIAAFGLSMPIIIEKVVDRHIDSRLLAKKDKVLNLIHRGGMQEIVKDEDCSYGNYNLLKQEYISVVPLRGYEKIIKIEETRRQIENEVLRFRTLSYSFTFDNQAYLLEVGEGLLPIDSLNEAIRTFSLLLVAIVLLLSIFIDFGFARMVMFPLYSIVRDKLQSFSHPISANTKRVKTTTEEFIYLDKSIDELMVKVKSAFLIEKEFIANASHELLTPISIINNKLENILQDSDTPEKLAIKIVDCQKTLQRLTRIIKSLLLISKVENEQFLKDESISLNELLDEVLEEIGERCVAKRIVLKRDTAATITLHQINRSLLFTMLFNILNNAVKYNKSEGSILVKTEEETGKLKLIIEDTGIGIEQTQIASIFERFKRGSSSEQEGYGLGLPIVKTIARFHGIEIDVQSELGRGSIFTISFPDTI